MAFLGIALAPHALGFDRVRRAKKHPSPDENLVLGGAARWDLRHWRPQMAFGGASGDVGKTCMRLWHHMGL
jgi:hypothetical protein